MLEAASTPTVTAQASAFFTFEKQAASLSDLDIVRKIVEREGCLEALEQLLRGKATQGSQSASEIEQVYPYTYSYAHRGSKAATTSPMVLQSLLDQLRSVSVQIIESIERWRTSSQTQVFQWRQVNYLLKMTRDLDFLATVPVHVDALQQLRLERNPFLAPLHLDHPALRERVPDAAVLLGLGVGSVDMRRVFYASKVLLRELEAERKQQQLAQTQSDSNEVDDVRGSNEHERDGVCGELHRTMAVVDPSVLSASKYQRSQQQSMRMRWSNQDVRAVQTRGAANGKPQLVPLSETDVLAPRDRNDEMRRDLELSRELILHAEHELGAIREEVAILQARLAQALAQPERRRKLQNKLGALINALKFRSGDLYQRKNELRRKEAVYRLACDRSTAGSLNRSSERLTATSVACHDSSVAESPRSPDAYQHAYLRAVDSAMQEDELRRQEIVEKFMALAQMRAAASSTSRHKHKQQLAKVSVSSKGKSKSKSKSNSNNISRLSIQEMAPDDVAALVDSLDLGWSYGNKFRSQGIDGALLLQATDRDLEELGVSLRLHRVRILEAVARMSSSR